MGGDAMTVPDDLPKRVAKAMLDGKYAEAATLIADLESRADQHAALDDVHALMERVAIDQGVSGRIDVDRAANGIDEIRSKLRAARPATAVSRGEAAFYVVFFCVYMVKLAMYAIDAWHKLRR